MRQTIFEIIILIAIIYHVFRLQNTNIIIKLGLIAMYFIVFVFLEFMFFKLIR